MATLMYQYDHNLAMEEEDRFLNPLGFQVTQYRVDIDRATTPNLGVDESLSTALQASATPVASSASGEAAVGPPGMPPPESAADVSSIPPSDGAATR